MKRGEPRKPGSRREECSAQCPTAAGTTGRYYREASPHLHSMVGVVLSKIVVGCDVAIMC